MELRSYALDAPNFRAGRNGNRRVKQKRQADGAGADADSVVAADAGVSTAATDAATASAAADVALGLGSPTSTLSKQIHLKKTTATCKQFTQEFGAAVRNFYPIDLEGQTLERATKVQMARQLCSDVFDEMTGHLRCLRGLLKSTAPLLPETEFIAFQRAASALVRLRRQYVEDMNANHATKTENQRHHLRQVIEAIKTFEPVFITLGYLSASAESVQATDSH